jgi:hypothetical protein
MVMDLVRSVLPALAPGEPSELVDDETREQNLSWVSAIERVAGEAVRKHYAALSADPHVVEVGKLLANAARSYAAGASPIRRRQPPARPRAPDPEPTTAKICTSMRSNIAWTSRTASAPCPPQSAAF